MPPKGPRQHGDPGNRWVPCWHLGGAAYAPVRGGTANQHDGSSRVARTNSPTVSSGWVCTTCQGYNAPWAKGCATCWAQAPAAKLAPWYRGKKDAAKAASAEDRGYSPPDPNAAERRAVSEQLRATRAALVSLQRLGAAAFPKARAASWKAASAATGALPCWAR